MLSVAENKRGWVLLRLVVSSAMVIAFRNMVPIMKKLNRELYIKEKKHTKFRFCHILLEWIKQSSYDVSPFQEQYNTQDTEPTN